jgi:hypothetical protein
MGRDAKKVNQMYKKNVEGFYKFIYAIQVWKTEKMDAC